MNKSVYWEHYKQLIGFTVVDVLVADETDDVLLDEVNIALFLKRGNTELVAYLLSDEEGNGTGHLDIQEIVE